MKMEFNAYSVDDDGQIKNGRTITTKPDSILYLEKADAETGNGRCSVVMKDGSVHFVSEETYENLKAGYETNEYGTVCTSPAQYDSCYDTGDAMDDLPF